MKNTSLIEKLVWCEFLVLVEFKNVFGFTLRRYWGKRNTAQKGREYGIFFLRFFPYSKQNTGKNGDRDIQNIKNIVTVGIKSIEITKGAYIYDVHTVGGGGSKI